MSETAAPSVIIAFGAVSVPQADVAEFFAHLGCSKEVGSYEVKLYNWNGKYSHGGAKPITVGLAGSLNLGRSPNCPLLMTLRVEKVNYQSSPTESFVTVSGRCLGERLFRRVVTGTYSGMKGEEIVKDLMDYYAGLSHVRSGAELVEGTDTTYTELKPENSPVWDILKYIAESSDKAGVIGFDFRVAPDGKFEFFRKLSKTNSVVINESIDNIAEYEKDITRVRNKVTVYGLADKSVPSDKVSWTRSLTPVDGAWSAGSGTIGTEATGAPDGGVCVKLTANNLYWGEAIFTLNAGKEANTNLFPLVSTAFKLDDGYSGTGLFELYDSSGKVAQKSISVSPDEDWHIFEQNVGSLYANHFEHVQSGFNWSSVKVARIRFYFPQPTASGVFRMHALYFGGCRFSAVVEDAASIASIGLREYVEVDEELYSDVECSRRASALLAYLKDAAEHLRIVSTVLNYGMSPILAGDKVHVVLPTEGVNGDFRVESAEYRIPKGDTTTLEITLELGKEPPHLADYLYGLRTHTPNVEKLSRTKLGKTSIPVASGSGGAGSSGSYFTSNVEIDKSSPVLNLLINRVLKAAFGHDGANAVLAAYSGDLILASAVNKVIRCTGDGSDDLGCDSFRFKKGFFKDGVKVAGVDTIGSDGRVSLAGMPRGTSGYVLAGQGTGDWPQYSDVNYLADNLSADAIIRGGVTADVPVAKVGGGTRTLHFVNSRFTGFTDS